METPMPMKTGIVADPPTQEELCKGFMNFVQNPGNILYKCYQFVN